MSNYKEFEQLCSTKKIEFLKLNALEAEDILVKVQSYFLQPILGGVRVRRGLKALYDFKDIGIVDAYVFYARHHDVYLLKGINSSDEWIFQECDSILDREMRFLFQKHEYENLDTFYIRY